MCIRDSLVTGGRDGKVKLWNRPTLDANSDEVPQFAVRPVESDRHEEYSLLATFVGHDAAVNAVKLKDNVVVSGSGDSIMCIWSLRTGKILHKVNIHQRGIACLQYNGRFIVSGSTDNSVKIYDVDQKVEVACLEGHTNLVRSVQAVYDDSREAKTIISGSYDGSVRFWEQVPGSREWRTEHQAHLNGFQAQGNVRADGEAKEFGDRIFSIALDANRLVCSGQGPIIRVWDLRAPRK